ncbi:hypothetical protein [Streptosporangium sp. NPDC002721]|uniref:hypothetical protein n=1 Tax=Streptosporangium sp. NPDC002721 TaxID=3366188 RepID=UPI00367439CE
MNTLTALLAALSFAAVVAAITAAALGHPPYVPALAAGIGLAAAVAWVALTHIPAPAEPVRAPTAVTEALAW